MKLSAKTEYAIRAIFELAKNNGQPLKLKIIAERQGISIKYLEQLIAALKATGLIRSIRGPKGGYILAKPPKQISIEDIFKTIEGPIATTECLENEDCCPQINNCVIRELWQKLQNAITEMLKSVTLQDLVDKTWDKKRLTYQI